MKGPVSYPLLTFVLLLASIDQYPTLLFTSVIIVYDMSFSQIH